MDYRKTSYPAALRNKTTGLIPAAKNIPLKQRKQISFTGDTYSKDKQNLYSAIVLFVTELISLFNGFVGAILAVILFPVTHWLSKNKKSAKP